MDSDVEPVVDITELSDFRSPKNPSCLVLVIMFPFARNSAFFLDVATSKLGRKCSSIQRKFKSALLIVQVTLKEAHND